MADHDRLPNHMHYKMDSNHSHCFQVTFDQIILSISGKGAETNRLIVEIFPSKNVSIVRKNTQLINNND